jgi:all-trans-retinol dehydrogenase (NAD+)
MISPFNPIITGPLLYLLTHPPTSLIPHLNSLLTYLPSTLTHSHLVKLLRILFSLGLIYRASSALTERSLNNGQWSGDRERWEWKKEVAVVTGGCSGIGEEVVKGLKGKGVRVVVLDVADLPDRLKDGTYHVILDPS